MRDRAADFERHAREQRDRWLALTPEERLLWLERAKRFERAVRAARPTTATGEAPPRAGGGESSDGAGDRG